MAHVFHSPSIQNKKECDDYGTVNGSSQASEEEESMIFVNYEDAIDEGISERKNQNLKVLSNNVKYASS